MKPKGTCVPSGSEYLINEAVNRAPYRPLYLSIHKQKGARVPTPIMGHLHFIPYVILAILSRSPPVVTQIRGHIAGPPPSSPLPTLRYVPSLFLSREENSAFSSLLVDSRRIVPTHAARRSQQLILLFFSFLSFFFRVFANKYCVKILTTAVGIDCNQGPTLLVVFEGNH